MYVMIQYFSVQWRKYQVVFNYLLCKSIEKLHSKYVLPCEL